jgi:hypothetical protein
VPVQVVRIVTKAGHDLQRGRQSGPFRRRQ